MYHLLRTIYSIVIEWVECIWMINPHWKEHTKKQHTKTMAGTSRIRSRSLRGYSIHCVSLSLSIYRTMRYDRHYKCQPIEIECCMGNFAGRAPRPTKCMGKIRFSVITFHASKTWKLWIHNSFCRWWILQQFCVFTILLFWAHEKLFPKNVFLV
jgi:hypothetical protein